VGKEGVRIGWVNFEIIWGEDETSDVSERSNLILVWAEIKWADYEGWDSRRAFYGFVLRGE
jgi:hypothetical protein